MSYSKKTKFLLVLGFIFFFVLFLPVTDNLLVAQAKDLSTSDETTIVKEVLPEIKLNVKRQELPKGKSYKLKVYNTTDTQTVSFKSNDATIASVTDTGMVDALEIGSATITVTVKEGNKVVKTLTCDITVGVPALSVRFTKSDLLLVVGQKTTIRVLTAPYNTVEVARFTSYDSSIVSISTGGRITANAAGSTYVYALIDNGAKSKCKVTVISEETYAALSELGITDLTTISDLDSALSTITPKPDENTSGNTESSTENTPTPTVEPTSAPSETPSTVQ